MTDASSHNQTNLALGLLRNAEALVSVMDGLADEIAAWGHLDISEPVSLRLERLLEERGALRSALQRTRRAAAA